VRNKGGKVEKTRERDRESVHGREGERGMEQCVEPISKDKHVTFHKTICIITGPFAKRNREHASQRI